MKIDLIAVNRLGRTSENAMTRDFCERASVQGRSLALGPVDLTEVEPRKRGKDAEGEVILAAAEGAYLIVCDERGKQYASRAFAERLGKLRDQGERRIAFVIGGADGTSDAVKAAAALAFVSAVVDVSGGKLVGSGMVDDGATPPRRIYPYTSS